MITIVELAKLAGVSDATVSLVLAGKDKGRVSASRRQQILDLAHKHGYRPNQAARGPRRGYPAGLTLRTAVGSGSRGDTAAGFP
jgi:DNA-binding LacI/PurR family transcriptional regulator